MAKQSERSDGEKEFEFNHRDFDRVRELIYKRAGISLSESKQEMVYSRLARRLRATGINSFATYLNMLERETESQEWESFTNALTTNLTSFFREELRRTCKEETWSLAYMVFRQFDWRRAIFNCDDGL